MSKHHHQAELDAIVQTAIKRIADNKISTIIEVDQQAVKELIIEGDQTMTVLFWYVLYQNPKYTKYNHFDYCHSCKKFNLY